MAVDYVDERKWFIHSADDFRQHRVFNSAFKAIVCYEFNISFETQLSSDNQLDNTLNAFIQTEKGQWLEANGTTPLRCYVSYDISIMQNRFKLIAYLPEEAVTYFKLMWP